MGNALFGHRERWVSGILCVLKQINLSVRLITINRPYPHPPQLSVHRRAHSLSHSFQPRIIQAYDHR